jgi:hypothetical protein
MNDITRNSDLEHELASASLDKGKSLLALFGYDWVDSGRVAWFPGDKLNTYSYIYIKNHWAVWSRGKWQRLRKRSPRHEQAKLP